MHSPTQNILSSSLYRMVRKLHGLSQNHLDKNDINFIEAEFQARCHGKISIWLQVFNLMILPLIMIV